MHGREEKWDIARYRKRRKKEEAGEDGRTDGRMERRRRRRRRTTMTIVSTGQLLRFLVLYPRFVHFLAS